MSSGPFSKRKRKPISRVQITQPHHDFGLLETTGGKMRTSAATVVSPSLIDTL